MGSRSFMAWEAVERILNELPDGRKAWRHSQLPVNVTVAEQHGEPVVGRAWLSKSLFINEAIMHYYRTDVQGESCAGQRMRIKYLEAEVERLQSRRWWHWTR